MLLLGAGAVAAFVQAGADEDAGRTASRGTSTSEPEGPASQTTLPPGVTDTTAMPPPPPIGDGSGAGDTAPGEAGRTGQVGDTSGLGASGTGRVAAGPAQMAETGGESLLVLGGSLLASAAVIRRLRPR